MIHISNEMLTELDVASFRSEPPERVLVGFGSFDFGSSFYSSSSSNEGGESSSEGSLFSILVSSFGGGFFYSSVVLSDFLSLVLLHHVLLNVLGNKIEKVKKEICD